MSFQEIGPRVDLGGGLWYQKVRLPDQAEEIIPRMSHEAAIKRSLEMYERRRREIYSIPLPCPGAEEGKINWDWIDHAEKVIWGTPQIHNRNYLHDTPREEKSVRRISLMGFALVGSSVLVAVLAVVLVAVIAWRIAS